MLAIWYMLPDTSYIIWFLLSWPITKLCDFVDTSHTEGHGDNATGLSQFLDRLREEGQASHRDGGHGDGAVEEDNEEVDEILNFHTDLLYSGVIQLTQKMATQHGACNALTAFWKNSLVTYHENGKVGSLIIKSSRAFKPQPTYLVIIKYKGF